MNSYSETSDINEEQMPRGEMTTGEIADIAGMAISEMPRGEMTIEEMPSGQMVGAETACMAGMAISEMPHGEMTGAEMSGTKVRSELPSVEIHIGEWKLALSPIRRN